jgi:hypothetical protein
LNIFKNQGCGGREIPNIKAAGLIVSAQHEGVPSATSSGNTQARNFVNNGGQWQRDCQTLPGTLHMQFSNAACNAPGAFTQAACCYGLDQAGIRSWIADWVTTYTALTGQTPIISTDDGFWRLCTGNWDGLAANPLVIARAVQDNPTCTAIGPECPITSGFAWSMFTFWLDQRGQAVPGITGAGSNDVFQDQYEGSLCKLQLFAGATQNG